MMLLVDVALLSGRRTKRGERKGVKERWNHEDEIKTGETRRPQ
jgi:hypothetical protein